MGSDTFSVAHKNMDKIRLQTRMVPEYLQDALSTISEVFLLQRTCMKYKKLLQREHQYPVGRRGGGVYPYRGYPLPPN